MFFPVHCTAYATGVWRPRKKP